MVQPFPVASGLEFVGSDFFFVLRGGPGFAMSQLDMVVSCCGAWNGQVQNERSIAESEARPRSPRRAWSIV